MQDILFPHGVEFPCGGRGRCKGCKIKVLAGVLPVTASDNSQLSADDLAQGWRLACWAKADSDLKIDLGQWESAILSDDSHFSFEAREGLGVAVDLGTTTIVAQLLDLQTGQVLAVSTALNEQARHGADIMSRVEFALSNQGQQILERLIRHQIAELIRELLTSTSQPARGASISANFPGLSTLESVVLVGNTVMHHLFSGISIEPLAQFPFEPESPGLQTFASAALGWHLPGNPKVYFLPCPGGFVGSDILAGILATQLHQRDSPAMLIDLGTNGEIVLGNRERLLCTATAAGPAFEGARISMGMRAATGAIARVQAAGDQLHCQVLGNTKPRGICGSGLVDAVAAGLEMGWLLPNGRLKDHESITLAPPVTINQSDIRELQLAKGAIAAGVRLLLKAWGSAENIQVFLAGAFGNYINQSSAQRIGLLRFPRESVRSAGNTALLGAKLALFNLPRVDATYHPVLQKVKHLPLNEDPGFQDAYIEEMAFQ